MIDRTYPAWMTHPAFEPATISGPTSNAPAIAARFPPVMVNNLEQEQEYVAKGYSPVDRVDPSYFAPREPAPAVYVPIEYPKWVQGNLMENEEEHRILFPEDFPADEHKEG